MKQMFEHGHDRNRKGHEKDDQLSGILIIMFVDVIRQLMFITFCIYSLLWTLIVYKVSNIDMYEGFIGADVVLDCIDGIMVILMGVFV